jgi:hypothetical protein
MFPIMTEEQIKAADEEVLRQRVRELSSASAVLREIRDFQERANRSLLVIADLLMGNNNYLVKYVAGEIAKHLRPKMRISTARPNKGKRWPGAGSKGVRKAIYTQRAKKVKVTLAKPDKARPRT